MSQLSNILPMLEALSWTSGKFYIPEEDILSRARFMNADEKKNVLKVANQLRNGAPPKK